MSKAWGLFGPSQKTTLLAWAIGLLLGSGQRFIRDGVSAIVTACIALRSTSVIVVGLHLTTVFADEADLALCLQDSPGDLIHVGDAR